MLQINSDDLYSHTDMIDASKFIEGSCLGADGNRMVFVARGDVFTVPADKGITRDISRTSGVHERSAIWSPDGKYVAFISDSSGEDEIYIQVPDGQSKPIRITTTAMYINMILPGVLTARKLLWGDKKMRLQLCRY